MTVCSKQVLRNRCQIVVVQKMDSSKRVISAAGISKTGIEVFRGEKHKSHVDERGIHAGTIDAAEKCWG